MKKGSIHPSRMDYTGQKSSMLTVIGFAYYKGKHSYWTCQCECGVVKVIAATHLHGHTKSCGCRPNKRGYKHGGSHSPEWAVWKSMRQRCENPKAISYPDYGGRGIQVCARWKKFANFLADMGKRPVGPVRLTLERNDNDGNYEPTNCRWATYAEQSMNKRPVQLTRWELKRDVHANNYHLSTTSDGLLHI